MSRGRPKIYTAEERIARQAESQRRSYEKYHGSANEYQRTHNASKKAVAIAMKGGRCCQCGYEYDGTNAPAFDFHHRDGRVTRSMGRALQTMGLQRLLAEIENCDLLCSNCHRIVHWGTAAAEV